MKTKTSDIFQKLDGSYSKHKMVGLDKRVHETDLHEVDEKVFWIKESQQKGRTLMYYWNYRV